MLDNCKVIVGDKTYSITEFKALILEKGIGGVFVDSSELSRKLTAKYDFLEQEDSLVEDWAKLEARKRDLQYNGTAAQINDLIYPEGQLTDYSVQETIRYNTYSGISLTGIAANFGKVLGYLFQTTPITQIQDKETLKTFDLADDSTKELLNEYQVKSIDELVIKSSRFVPTKREEVLINKNININGQKLTTFSRDEKEFMPKQNILNIFEGIDTIINLAIDNVKEQKLHVLGITGSNANSYLSLIGMGVPMSIVSKIFKSPAIARLNFLGRYKISTINKEIISPNVDLLQEASITELAELLKVFDVSEISAQDFYDGLRLKDPGVFLSQYLPIQTKILDSIYTNEASVYETAASNIVLGETIKALIPIGETLFDYAQIFALLKGMPNKKWKIDSLVKRIEKYAIFAEEKIAAAQVKQVFKDEIKKKFIEENSAYKLLLEEKGEDEAEAFVNKEIKKVDNSSIIYGDLYRQIRASFVNRLLRGSTSKVIKSPENSPLPNSSPLRLPHVFEAYKSLVLLQNIIEKSFIVHSPVVQKFVKDLLNEASIFSPFDMLEKSDLVQKDLIKYLTSALEFEIDGENFTTEVDSSISYTSDRFGVIYGIEAWAQKFIEEIFSLPYNDNEFLSALEFTTDSTTGYAKLGITGDKVNDEELLEYIRRDFVTFAQEHPKLAKNLFKYNLLSSSMYYEKTGFSLVFPDSWVVAYSNALEQRLNTIIPFASPSAQYNLEILKQDFLYQFLKNNSKLITFPSGVKAEATSFFFRNFNGEERKTPFYGGEVEIDGNTYYFDLRLHKVSLPQKFIRQYNDDVYIKLNIEGDFDYYAKITEKVGHTFYNFQPHQLEKSLDLQALQTGKFKLVNTTRIRNNTAYLTTDLGETLKEGQVILAYDKSGGAASVGTTYVVTGEKEPINVQGKSVWKYPIKSTGTVDLSMKNKIADLKNAVKTFVNTRLGSTIGVDDATKAAKFVKQTPNSFYITNNYVDFPHVILSIPEWKERPSKEEQETYLKKIISQIEKLDVNTNYFVDNNLFAKLTAFSSFRTQIAEALFAKIGYVSPFVDVVNTEQALSTQLTAALRRSDVVSLTFKRSFNLVETSPQEEGTHKLIKDKKFLPEQEKRALPGGIVYFGNELYGFVESSTETELILSLFNEEMFVQYIDRPFYSKEEFEEIKKKYYKC